MHACVCAHGSMCLQVCAVPAVYACIVYVYVHVCTFYMCMCCTVYTCMYVYHMDNCAECIFCSYTFLCIGILCKYVHICACMLHGYVKCSVHTYVHMYSMCSVQCVCTCMRIYSMCMFYTTGTYLRTFYARICMYTSRDIPCGKYIYMLSYTLCAWVHTLCT